MIKLENRSGYTRKNIKIEAEQCGIIRTNPLIDNKKSAFSISSAFIRLYQILNPRKSASTKAFSLLELLLYVAILVIIMVFLSGAFLSFLRGRSRVEAKNEVNSNLHFAVEKISQDVASASSVSIPASAGATSTSLVLIVSGSEVTYCVSGGQLRRQVSGPCNSSSSAITSSNITVATSTFTRLENTNTVLGKTIVSIEISLSMGYNSASPDWQYEASRKTTVSLR